METAPLRVENRLDRASNFLSWKARVTLALKEYDLWELVDKAVTPSTDPAALDTHNKKEIKAERVLLESMKDHLIPHLTEKMTTKVMFDALVSLFQSKNMNRKIILRNKLISVHMSRSDNVSILSHEDHTCALSTCGHSGENRGCGAHERGIE
jgi:hypothetical protein